MSNLEAYPFNALLLSFEDTDNTWQDELIHLKKMFQILFHYHNYGFIMLKLASFVGHMDKADVCVQLSQNQNKIRNIYYIL